MANAQQPPLNDLSDHYPPDEGVLRQLAELREMTVAELQARHLELYGFETRSRHKQQLFKRLAWRIQELRYGGLKQETLDRLEEIADEADARYLPPRKPKRSKPPRRQEVRYKPSSTVAVPPPGSVLVREHKGTEHRVTVLEDGFEYRGQVHRSLSGIARDITGTSWNGKRFFGLVDAKGRTS